MDYTPDEDDFKFTKEEFESVFGELIKSSVKKQCLHYYENFRFNSEHLGRTGYNGTEMHIKDYGNVNPEDLDKIIEELFTVSKDWKYREIVITTTTPTKKDSLFILCIELYGGFTLLSGETFEQVDAKVERGKCSTCNKLRIKRSLQQKGDGPDLICDYCDYEVTSTMETSTLIKIS